MTLLFAPAATAHLTRQFFPARSAGRRSFFVIGSPVFWILFFYIFAALAAAVVGVWLSLLAVVWAAQLGWLITAGPFVAVHRVRHPPLPPAPPRFVQHEVGHL